MRTPIVRYSDSPALVATAEVRAPEEPFVIVLGAGPRRAGDLVSQLASMSGAPVFIVLINPAVGGARHDLSNESVISGLVLLAARRDCMAVIASPPRQSYQLSATSGQPMYRNVQSPEGIMINGQVNDLAKQENSILANCI